MRLGDLAMAAESKFLPRCSRRNQHDVGGWSGHRAARRQRSGGPALRFVRDLGPPVCLRLLMNPVIPAALLFFAHAAFAAELPGARAWGAVEVGRWFPLLLSEF